MHGCEIDSLGLACRFLVTNLPAIAPTTDNQGIDYFL
jgi:hypothetical protein